VLAQAAAAKGGEVRGDQEEGDQEGCQEEEVAGAVPRVWVGRLGPFPRTWPRKEVMCVATKKKATKKAAKKKK